MAVSPIVLHIASSTCTNVIHCRSMPDAISYNKTSCVQPSYSSYVCLIESPGKKGGGGNGQARSGLCSLVRHNAATWDGDINDRRNSELVT